MPILSASQRCVINSCKKIKEQVNKVLETDGGALAKPAPEKSPPIAAVYFASFVVQ